MRDFKILIWICVSVLLISSCQKKTEWTCTCNVTHALSGKKETTSTSFNNQTRNDANTNCNNFGKQSVNNNGSWSCSIKEI